MHSFGVKWITAIALAISLAGCSTTAPSETLVTMAESGQCAEVQGRVDVLFTAYDQLLGYLKAVTPPIYGETENDLRRYLQTFSQQLADIPRELWTSVETGTALGIQSRTADVMEELRKSVFIGVPPLTPEQASIRLLVEARRTDAVTATYNQPPSDTPFLQGVGVLETFPPYANRLKEFMTSYCPAA